MFKRTHYIALILIVLAVLILIKLPAQTVGRLKLAISSLYLPFFGVAGSTHTLASKTGDALLSKRELLLQTKNLRQENRELRLQLQQFQDAWRENARLRQQLGWRQRSPWKLKAARVISRDPANWWRSLQIDLGTRDGIRTNMAVLTCDQTGGYLVGRIQTLGETRSQVILLGDPNLRVSATVRDSGNGQGATEQGIILPNPSGTLENNIVDLGFLSGTSTIRPGQFVETSGDGGVFPKGIQIGRIVDSRTKDFGVSTDARVRLSANLGALEEVWVMLP